VKLYWQWTDYKSVTTDIKKITETVQEIFLSFWNSFPSLPFNSVSLSIMHMIFKYLLMYETFLSTVVCLWLVGNHRTKMIYVNCSFVAWHMLNTLSDQCAMPWQQITEHWSMGRVCVHACMSLQVHNFIISVIYFKKNSCEAWTLSIEFYRVK